MLNQSRPLLHLRILPFSLVMAFLINCSSFSRGLKRKSCPGLSVGVVGLDLISSTLAAKVREPEVSSPEERRPLSAPIVSLVRNGLTFSVSFHQRSLSGRSIRGDVSNDTVEVRGFRSEERRVGKEGRCRWGACQ